jgi:hypothetical protein
MEARGKAIRPWFGCVVRSSSSRQPTTCIAESTAFLPSPPTFLLPPRPGEARPDDVPTTELWTCIDIYVIIISCPVSHIPPSNRRGDNHPKKNSPWPVSPGGMITVMLRDRSLFPDDEEDEGEENNGRTQDSRSGWEGSRGHFLMGSVLLLTDVPLRKKRARGSGFSLTNQVVWCGVAGGMGWWVWVLVLF